MSSFDYLLGLVNSNVAFTHGDDDKNPLIGFVTNYDNEGLQHSGPATLCNNV